MVELAETVRMLVDKVDSLEARIASLEEKIGQFMQWRAVQDQRWRERDKMNGSISASISSIETKLDSLKEDVIELKTASRQKETDQSSFMKKMNIALAVFAGLMMLGTLVVQIVATAR